MTPQQLSAVRSVARAIVDTVRAAGAQGGLAGTLQLRMVTARFSYAQCRAFTDALLQVGRLERRGQHLVVPARPH